MAVRQLVYQLAVLVLLTVTSFKADATPPNIVLLFADDVSGSSFSSIRD